MKYRKKPVVIEAFQYNVDPRPDWFTDAVSENLIVTFDDPLFGVYCRIETLEGVMQGNAGDFIIQGVNSEIYPCKPEIFAKTYEPAETTRNDTTLDKMNRTAEANAKLREMGVSIFSAEAQDDPSVGSHRTGCCIKQCPGCL
jgi:hypothetical protein